MKFFILSLEHEKDKIIIYARDENKNRCKIEAEFPFYIYVIPYNNYFNEVYRKIDDLEIEKKLIIETKKWMGKEYKAIKVIFKEEDYEKIKKICDLLKEEGKIIGKKEVDLSRLKKFSIDNNLYPLYWYDLDVELVRETKNFKVYKLKNINQRLNDSYDFKVVAVDIEVLAEGIYIPDPEKHPVQVIGIYDGEKYFIIYWGATSNTGIQVKNEYELFEKFNEIIKDLDPDVLVGYNSHNFDLNYLYERCKKINFRFSFGWDEKGIILTKKREEDRRYKISGIQHVDLFIFLSNIFSGQLKSETLSLDSVAKEILGYGKEEMDLNMIRNALKQKDFSSIVKYNQRDVEITYKLYKHFEPILIELSKITGQSLYETSLSTYGTLIENYLIKKSRELGEIVPNKPKIEEIEERSKKTYTGAFVLEPEPGFYKNIAVFDFRSLYPSIMIAYNISPDTLNCDHDYCKQDSIEIETNEGKMNVWFCKNRKGYVPTILDEIFRERSELKKKLKQKNLDYTELKILDAKQYALKILLNSMYGYLGFSASRWYCINCAAAITAYGRQFIKKTIEYLEKRGFKIIYGDTDSIFVILNSKEDLRIIDEINSILPKPMELELENFYISGIFVGRRGEHKGAKKKYALLAEDGTIKLRGFEAVRRDWSELSKMVQENVIKLALREDKDGIINYLREIINKIRKKELPLEYFIIREQLRKSLNKYEVEAPHVVAAKKYRDIGYKVNEGFIVEYIICSGKEKISDKVKIPNECKNKEYDPEYYIEKQVFQPIEGIIKLFNINKEVIISGQKDILRFFK
ncbi:MAG: DNA-directed DNA polymerase [Candidatus Aenigmatarchaeota archaeon]